MSLWTFHASVPHDRRRKLAAYHSFDNIVGALVLEVHVKAFLWQPFRGAELRGCNRAEFLLQVPSPLYDAFFNSPAGYRAQYAMSVELGRQKNRELIDALRTKLIATADSKADVANVAMSLDGVEAKIWIHEEEVQEHYFDDSPEIDYSPWQEKSEDGAGLRAPLGTKLVVCGGWIDKTGHERLNPFKLRRSEEIHEVGFS